MQPELIVFVDEDGQPTGETGPKLESHTDKTRLTLGVLVLYLSQA